MIGARKNNYLELMGRSGAESMKSVILRMIRCGRSTIPTMLSHAEQDAPLFKNQAVAPKFGRFSHEVSKPLQGEGLLQSRIA